MVREDQAPRYVIKVGVFSKIICLFFQAIPLAIFLLLEKDVEENGDDQATALFVEVFGDRQHFFNLCIRELEKAELIIEQNMASKPHGQETDISVEDLEDIEKICKFQKPKKTSLKYSSIFLRIKVWSL